MEAVRRTDGSLSGVAADLGVRFAVVGSFQRHGDRIRSTARVVDVSSGEALADAKVEAIVVRCDGRTFIAGADIREFGRPRKPPGLKDFQALMDGA